MSKCKDYSSLRKPITVSELKIDIPVKKSKKNNQDYKKFKSGVFPRSSVEIEKPKPSVETLSIQSLEMPEVLKTKPFIKAKCPPIADEVLKNPEATPKSPSDNIVASYDSRLDGWVTSTPRKFKSKCSATASTASSLSLSTISVDTSPNQKVDVSKELVDTMHAASKKRLRFKGSEWEDPCKESFVVGAPRPYIGVCPKNPIELAKLSETRQKFFVTRDPRKTRCLRNPEVLRKKAYSTEKEFNALTEMVKEADNICTATDSQSTDSVICDVIDLENPLKLDFQGLDYKTTYQNDEQDINNHILFRRVVRFMDRKSVKAETKVVVEKELQQERLAVPAMFAIKDRNEVIPPSPSVESVHFGKLVRAADKPQNKKIIAEEHKRRVERYKDLYLRRKERNEELQQKELEKQKMDEEELATTLMLNNFNGMVDGINDAIRRTFRQERKLKRKEVQRRIFPHTLRETLQFKRELKAKKHIARDEARIKQEFYKELGKTKNYPEADMDISTDSAKLSSESRMSEQSSDDEDALRVGKEDKRFKLRGFQFSLGDEIRGKLHRGELEGTKGQRRPKGCITRDQWLSELAPPREKIKLDVETGIEKIKSPDDPEMVLFPPEVRSHAKKVEISPIKEYRQQRLGHQYDRTLHKKLKIIKPKLRYNVKKFNLIRFLYKEDDKKDESIEEDPEKTMSQKGTKDYIEAKMLVEQKNEEKIRQKRLDLLGIPCKFVKKSRIQTRCERSDTESDSDWVPSQEKDMESDSDIIRTQRQNVRVPLRQRGNMPAPRYREATLRCHPRRPRDYFGLRVPSLIFDQVVQTTNIPTMCKLKEDVMIYENLDVVKRPYTSMFEARHHHDHYDPTQKKILDVHYQRELVTADITKVKQKDKKTMKKFHTANPPCNAYVDMDLTLPNYDFDALIEEQAGRLKHKGMEAAKQRTTDICRAHDVIFHSRKKGETLEDFPGHQEYLEFLQEIRQQLQETKDDDTSEEILHVDRQAVMRELADDLRSIESCLTSLSSSECTNLTNDSGSFLLMEGKTKVPLDYIRKSLVPFEELQRSRFNFVPIDADAEDADQFKTMPFSGQKKDQQQLVGNKDGFFTFNTRLQNGLRLRLEVPVEDVRNKLLGRGKNKYPSLVTTDIDENYVEELKNRPSVKMFKFKSCGSMIKDALRLKFETLLIQGQIVRNKIYDRLNEEHWDKMQRTKILYEKLFAKWEKKEYETSMAVVYKVKTYYDMTDAMKREFRDMERKQLLLNMDIVYTEGDWIRRIMLQNFHYLLADADWRYENDWIHRVDPTDENSELENFEDSILNRTTVNIRHREKDDAWAIKAFYENHYLKNKHPVVIVFPSAESFLKGIENLKNKTFVLLLELHFTLSIHTELQGRLETFEDWCINDLAERKEDVLQKSSKKFFLIARASGLKETTMEFLQAPIERSFNDENFVRDRGVVTEVWTHIVPPNVRATSETDLEPVDMVAMMADVVMDILAKFERIPVSESQSVETALRKRTSYLQKISYQAYQIEKRIESEMKKVRKNLEPPYKPPRRPGRLPRLFLRKKRPPEIEEEKRVSEHTKFFFRAFHDEGDVMQMEEARESLFVIDTIQEQIVPFYFDHFLKLNGYTPSYNFKTQVELRDGPETDLIKVPYLLPEVNLRLERWEMMKQKIMEDNISRNPQMYVNVNF